MQARLLAVIVAAVLVFWGAGVPDARSQQLPAGMTADQAQQLMQSLPPDEQQKLQALMQGQQQGQQTQTQSTQPVVLTPAPAPTRNATGISQIEEIMSERIGGRPIKQFGYNQVGVGSSVTVPQTGAVQDDYVLGPGDEVNVTLRGQENSDFSVTVDRNGQVTLPKLSPIPAAGRTLGDFKRDLIAAVHKAYVSTEAFVSVDQLRQVSVMVAGEVDNPGTRIVTALSSPLDAILLSGGIKKSGSLRNIELIRNGRLITIDLYNVLTQQGKAPLIALRDGDRILVPPIGAAVAVAGAVRRPAIYELPAGQKATNLHQLVTLAAGTIVPGIYTTSILRLMPDGKLQYLDVSNEPQTLVHGGEVVLLKSAVNVSLGRVTLVGAARTPGAFALDKYPTLHDLLPSAEALNPGAYVLFGIVDRIDPKTMQHEALPFSPLHVIQGEEDLKLISEDTVHVLTEDGMRYLLQLAAAREQAQQSGLSQQISQQQQISQPQQNTAAPGTATPSLGAANTGLGAGAGTTGGGSVVGTTSNQSAAGAPSAAPGAFTGGLTGQANGGNTEGAGTGTEMTGGTSGVAGAGESDLGGFTAEEGSFFGAALSDYRVGINGAVLQPGDYLIAPNTTLAEALLAAHGLAIDVDLSSFELTSMIIDNKTGVSTTNRQRYPATKDELASIVLKPFDSVNFRHVFSDKASGAVTVEGEVRYPGTYQILRDEHLSSVLMRAGGLTDVAYPYGTVFLRQSVATQERDGFQREAKDIRSQIFMLMMRPAGTNTSAPSLESFAAISGLLTQIEAQPALGRISFVADPAVLAARPDRDPLLEPGDSIVVPKRPTSVTVLGEVLQPGSFRFNGSLSANDYIEQAGGFSVVADSSRVIVVLPDGTARIPESSWLSFGQSDEIPPGSTIYVPRDLSRLDLHQIIVDTVQIFSQLATTAAALAVLSKQ